MHKTPGTYYTYLISFSFNESGKAVIPTLIQPYLDDLQHRLGVCYLFTINDVAKSSYVRLKYENNKLVKHTLLCKTDIGKGRGFKRSFFICNDLYKRVEKVLALQTIINTVTQTPRLQKVIIYITQMRSVIHDT